MRLLPSIRSHCQGYRRGLQMSWRKCMSGNMEPIEGTFFPPTSLPYPGSHPFLLPPSPLLVFNSPVGRTTDTRSETLDKGGRKSGRRKEGKKEIYGSTYRK